MALRSFLLPPAWLLLGVMCTGQNLVPNPSFDDITTCPTFASMLGLAAPWYNPTQGTPELYHACAPSGDYAGVPENASGGFQYPRTGAGMAGLFVYRTGIANMREYVEVQLTEPLEAGVCYSFRMFVNQPDDVELISDGIGAHFSIGPLESGTIGVLPVAPHIDRTNNLLITDSIGWTEVSGAYTASGGEDHLVIGNFRNDANTTWAVHNPDTWYTGVAYLLLDDVSLERMDNVLELGPDRTICPGEEVLLDASVPGATDVVWNDGFAGPVRTVTTAGTYAVTVSAGACVFTDTITVTVSPGPDFDLGPDRVLCTGEATTITISLPEGGSLIWEDGSTLPSRTISGNRVLQATLTTACGTASDTLNVITEECPEGIYLPNSFTPDNDGTNDTFLPVYDPRVWQVTYSIHDRWGRAIFSASDGAAWKADGLPIGVYVVRLEARSVRAPSTERKLVGHVTLLR